MGSSITVLTFAVVTTLGVSSSFAAGEPSFSKDLAATIALQGMPCDKVVASKPNGDSDYAVSCKDGNRYRVYVNGQGRVVVQKL
jgi:hypothetical protein